MGGGARVDNLKECVNGSSREANRGKLNPKSKMSLQRSSRVALYYRDMTRSSANEIVCISFYNHVSNELALLISIYKGK